MAAGIIGDGTAVTVILPLTSSSPHSKGGKSVVIQLVVIALLFQLEYCTWNIFLIDQDFDIWLTPLP